MVRLPWPFGPCAGHEPASILEIQDDSIVKHFFPSEPASDGLAS